MKLVPKVASRAALGCTVKVLENAQNALLDSTRVRKNKPRASSVQMVDHPTINQQPAKRLITKSKKTVTTTINTSTAHLPIKEIGYASHVHLVPLVSVTLHGMKSVPSTVIGV